jgi:hypothetical protein
MIIYPKKISFNKITHMQKRIIVLLLSLLVALFWLGGSHINLYRFAALGAAFEMLWFPMLALIFVLPLYSFFCWRKEKFNRRSLYMYSTLLLVATLLILVLGN